MGNPLRDRRTAAEWASAGQVIEITEKISVFDRLSEIVEADLAALDVDRVPTEWRESEVRGALQFGFPEQAGGIPVVTGQVTVAVDAVCQRCLEPFRLQLNIEPRLLLAKDNESIDEFDDFDVWELENETLRPQDVVEELLIMAMPFAATHDNMAECKAFSTVDAVATDMKRPFAGLAEQMKQVEKDPGN